MTGVLGVYLFLPFGLGPSPGWDDRCVKAILSVARSHFPATRIVVFAGDIRLVDAAGGRDALVVGASRLMSLLDQMGARYRAKEGKRWRPTRLIPWLGVEVDAHNNVVRMETRKVEKGLRLRESIFGSEPGASMQARDLLATASYLIFLQWVAPGGFRHLRSGWNAVNVSGVMDLRRPGARRAAADAAISEDLRNDMAWWWEMLRARPVKRLQFGGRGGFAWRPRLPNLRELALSSGECAVAAVYTDASSLHGWGASLGGHYIRGQWP